MKQKGKIIPLLYKGVLCKKFAKKSNRVFEIVVCVHNEFIISFRAIWTMVFIYLEMIIAYIYSVISLLFGIKMMISKLGEIIVFQSSYE